MNWTNERILELIENYSAEPILWDPQDPNHKKKHLNFLAWERIKSNLSWYATVDQLKSKIKSLMAYYRHHVNKQKKALQCGVPISPEDDVFQPCWFAFSAMNSFLAPVYEVQPNKEVIEINEENITRKRHYSEDSDEETPKLSVTKKRKSDHLYSEIIEDNSEIQDNIIEEPSQYIKISSNDEYEVFATLIACKIRKLKKQNTREIVMNAIQNLVFQAGMKEQENSTQPRESKHQYQNHKIYLSSPNRSPSQSPDH